MLVSDSTFQIGQKLTLSQLESLELVEEFNKATQIVGFFKRWDEIATVKLKIRRAILNQPFGNQALVDSINDRFMDLAKVKFK